MAMRILPLVAFCGMAALAGGAEMKAAWFRADITPQVGTKIAGYGPDDVSVGVAVDALLEIRAAAFPADSAGKDPYPDNFDLPLVNLPGGVKAKKRK